MSWANSKDARSLIGRGLSSMRRIIDYVDVVLGESRIVLVADADLELLQSHGWVLWEVSGERLHLKRKKPRP